MGYERALSASSKLTSKLALKAGHTVLYDRQPVEKIIAGTPDAIFEFDDVDTILSASLVINF